MGARRPSAPRPKPCPLSQLGRSAQKPRRTDGPKRASGSCILQRETLLGQQTTDSTRLRSRKQRKPFSAPAPRSPKRKAGLACPWLPGPCCFAGGFRRRKPSPHVFSFVGKQDCARESLLRPAPAMPLEPARPLSAEAPLHRRPKTSFWELHSAKGNTPPAANHSPNAPQIQRATQAVFAPGPTLSIAQSEAGLPLAPWALLHCWGSPAPET